MKVPAVQKLRAKLAANRPVFGLWVTLESPSISEMAVALGMDWIVIDAEHGHLDWREICDHLRATVRSDTVALVRIAELNLGLIKRALDIGADGVVVPWIESSEQLRQALSYAKFPPEGVRGIGAERATCWGQCFTEHTAEANENVLVIPIIESVKGGRNIQSLVHVPGVDIFFFGPADYSSSAGYRGQWEGPGVAKEILAVKDTIRAAGKYCGVVATNPENLLERQKQGFGMLGVGLDAGLLIRSLRGALSVVGRDCAIGASFTPECQAPPAQPLDRPPESMRPDRSEVMVSVGDGAKMEIGRGIEFECMVGAFNTARHLTTGYATFAPNSRLEYHTHTYAESISLISGSMAIDVEGRRYMIPNPLDNIVIPAGLAHAAQNLSPSNQAVVHIAMPTDTPGRTLVDKFFSRRAMPDDSNGVAGAEHVVRHRTAKRFDPGKGASFIDYFNSELVPGLEMSGGYGLFQPGGRLPAHIHDFDESISIVQGDATCLVEGRSYSLADGATALQPRGRVHYFINNSGAPMGMIWVYGGPMPERIVVDEKNCTPEGNPWK